jgi:hypothetical protein
VPCSGLPHIQDFISKHAARYKTQLKVSQRQQQQQQQQQQQDGSSRSRAVAAPQR